MKRILSNAVFGLVLLLLAAVICLRVSGMQCFSIISGSMSPALNVGDLVIVYPVDFDKINVDDIITYTVSENIPAVTHRVYSVDYDKGELMTKGDANEDVDGMTVDKSAVIGKVFFSMPYVGRLTYAAGTKTGRLFAVCLLVLLASGRYFLKREGEP